MEEKKDREYPNGAGEEKQAAVKRSLFGRLWKEWGNTVILLAVFLLLFKVVWQIAWVPTGSMETTIPARTVQFGWRLPYLLGDPLPERGDVFTFWSAEHDEVMVKRVIGLPGEDVSFSHGCVYINGKRLEESYLPVQGVTECEKSFTVPDGCVFFLGDNRTGSLDARYWEKPYIAVEELQAKVFLTVSIGKDRSWTGIRLMNRG